MSYAYNTLIGNGLQDFRLLQNNYSSVYSIPDSTANRAPAFNFIARHEFTSALMFSGNAWFRNIRTEGIDANFNTDVLGGPIYQPTPQEQMVLSAAGYTGFPSSGADITNTPFPKWPCIAEALARRRSGRDLQWRQHLLERGTERVRIFRPDNMEHFAQNRTKSVRRRSVSGSGQRGLYPEHRLRLCQPQLHHHDCSGMAGRSQRLQSIR